MTERVVIDARFNGPPGSGHGGHLCGMVAAPLAGLALSESGALHASGVETGITVA